MTVRLVSIKRRRYSAANVRPAAHVPAFMAALPSAVSSPPMVIRVSSGHIGTGTTPTGGAKSDRGALVPSVSARVLNVAEARHREPWATSGAVAVTRTRTTVIGGLQ